MPRGTKVGRFLDSSLSYSSEDEVELRVSENVNPQLEHAYPPLRTRTGPRLWWSVGLSVLGSAAAMAAAGCLCALLYPILKELRTETVRGHNGTEQGILGFWSILVMSVSIGCVCFVFSWALTYIDSRQRSGGLVLSLTQDKCRDAFVHDSCLGHGVAVLNGIMGFLTVIWSLT